MAKDYLTIVVKYDMEVRIVGDCIRVSYKGHVASEFEDTEKNRSYIFGLLEMCDDDPYWLQQAKAEIDERIREINQNWP